MKRQTDKAYLLALSAVMMVFMMVALHFLAVGGVYAFNKIKSDGKQPAKPATLSAKKIGKI